MSINPGTKWPTRTTAASGDYPYSSSKDESTPGANDGTPYEKARADDIFGAQQALLKFAGIVPSGNADTAVDSQYIKAVLDVALAGGFFTGGGTANALTFAVIGDRQGPADYTDGMQVSAVVSITNLAAATVNVDGIGVKNIVGTSGGELVAGRFVTLRYRAGSGDFEILVTKATTVQAGVVELATNAETITGTDTVRAVTPAGLESKVASFVESGIVELATNAEVKAGTDITRVAPVYQMVYHDGMGKGWINFNGTGTIAIRDSFNVSALVDSGTGSYQIQWDVDFTTANYCATVGVNTTVGFSVFCYVEALNASYTDIVVADEAEAPQDASNINVMAMGARV